MTRLLTVIRPGAMLSRDTGEVVSPAQLKAWTRTGHILRHLLRYDDVRMRTPVLGLMPRPLWSALSIRLLSRGRCVIEDDSGMEMAIGIHALVGLLRGTIVDFLSRGSMLAKVESTLSADASSRVEVRTLDLARRPLYLRTDFVFGLKSGGSVGHIAGVINTLGAFGGNPILATTDRIPTVDPEIETWILRPDGRFRDFAELPSFAFNEVALAQLRAHLGKTAPSFVYQRYSLNSFVGAEIAGTYGVPFVLEYNGSEVWIQRNWGEGSLKHGSVSERIELLDLARADVVVVVSEAMEVELRSRGISPEKILTNPNGVDPEVYRPDVDGSERRRQLGLEGKTVIGFIGTFGPWHGAETLAMAFAKLLRTYPEYRDDVRLVMIGDGDRLTATRQTIESQGAGPETVFVGRTAQEDGPSYLAACDILVSPHVANADGTRFFGSPTKLFEYMAMGKGIVASRLEQIGEVLEHDRTAWLVEPGNVDALVAGMRVLIEDPNLRARLGRGAREDAVAKHTWREHTRRIVERLQAVVADA